MKKLFPLLVTVLLTVSVFAQTPEKMSYQAVIRNANNQLIANTLVDMQICILQGSANGTAVYVETQRPSTNANGLVSIEIGAGEVESGSFANIDWQNGSYFIKTETDPTGGNNYSITGTSQILSVPFALHAKTAESANETDPEFNAWDKSSGISISESQITDLTQFTNADETDPVFEQSSAWGIEANDIENWNNKLDEESDPVFSSWDKSTGIAISESRISDLNHFTNADESDPVYEQSAASRINTNDIENWNNKLTTETDPEFTAWDKSSGISISESQISNLGNYIKVERDPLFDASPAREISRSDINRWNSKLGSYTETDPVFGAWDKSTGISITESQISDLDHFTTADETDPVYGASIASGITGTDTTNWNNKLDSETDPVFTAWDKTTGISITESQISDLDHFTPADETDPIYGTSVASGITGTDTTNWNNKLDSETDPAFTAWDKTTGISITESQISDLDHFTTADETDPIYGASVASGITGTDTTNWNNKLDSETDPVFTAWDKTTGISITESQISDLDHFTTADEADPIYGASVASGITGTDTTNWNNKLDTETDPAFTAWDKDYADLINIPAAADGSETKVTAGTNVTVTGSGTTASPYVVNATGGATLAIGDSYQGGIIFWLDATGQHGLIAAT
ncbi:MAG: hypothetical protein PF486_03605, partial [Prolixibacteraceae bacterium]|nr:hypothetical protein [Prolixibacteraceae bacterium]